MAFFLKQAASVNNLTVENNTEKVLNGRHCSVTSQHSKRKMVPKVLEHFTMVFPQKLLIGFFFQGISLTEKFIARIKLTLLDAEEMVSFVDPFA